MPNGTIGQVHLLLKEAVTLRSFNCQQKLSFSAVPTTGNYKITLYGNTTATIAHNATTATIVTRLADIGITVIVAGNTSTGFLITFGGALAGVSVPKIVITDNTLQKTATAVSITPSYTGNGRDSIGAWKEGIASDATIRACVQPLSGDDFQLLSEGDRKREILELYTKEAISDTQLIVRDGKIYEINKVERWYGYYYSWILARRPV